MLGSEALSAIRVGVEETPSPKKKAFSEDEKLFLVSRIEAYKNILLAKPGETPSRMKPYVWSMIADELNRRTPGNDRTAPETKKKWQNIVSQCRREMREAELRGVQQEAWPWLWKKINELTHRSPWYVYGKGGEEGAGGSEVSGDGSGARDADSPGTFEDGFRLPIDSEPRSPTMKSEIVLEDEEPESAAAAQNTSPDGPENRPGPSSLPLDPGLLSPPLRAESRTTGKRAAVRSGSPVEAKRGRREAEAGAAGERWELEKRDREEVLSQKRARFQILLRRLQLRNEMLEMEAEKQRLDLQLHRARVERELRMLRE